MHRAVLGMPQQAAMHGLALVLVGKGAGTKKGNVTLSPHCHFRSAQPDRLFPAEAPHDTRGLRGERGGLLLAQRRDVRL